MLHSNVGAHFDFEDVVAKLQRTFETVIVILFDHRPGIAASSGFEPHLIVFIVQIRPPSDSDTIGFRLNSGAGAGLSTATGSDAGSGSTLTT
jgi:hypothetical protein